MAANGTFTNMAATYSPASGGGTVFAEDSTAADSIIVNEGGVLSGGAGGVTEFADNATAGNATITCEGAQVTGAYSGAVEFFETTNAATATLIAKGGLDGADGGGIWFEDTTDGGEARVELFGNGKLDLTFLDNPAVGIGSLEGNGMVLLDTHSLTIGTNDASTVFSGVVQDSGGVTKAGAGTLTLAGANNYTGGTIVSEGFLRVANSIGSATGTGPVQIDGGTLGGGGIISGPVTVGSGTGSGAFLAPGTGATTVTLQSSLSFKADGTYVWRVRTTSVTADTVIAYGVTIEPGAHFDAIPKGNAQLLVGTIHFGVSTFVPSPKWQDYHGGGILNEEYRTAEKCFQQHLFAIAVPLGLIALVTGAFLRLPAIGTGLMFGGIFSICDGFVNYWSELADVWKFASLLVAFVLLIFLGYRRLERKEPG